MIDVVEIRPARPPAAHQTPEKRPARRLLVVRPDHVHAHVGVCVPDVVVVHGAPVLLARVVLRPGLAVFPVDVARLDGGGAVGDPVRVLVGVVGEDVGGDAQDVAGDGDAGVDLVHEDVDVGVAVAEDERVEEGPEFYGHLDDVGGGGVLLYGHGGGAEAALDVRVFAVLARVFDAAVLYRVHVAVGLADADDEVGVRVDDVVLAIVAVAPCGEDGGRGEK